MLFTSADIISWINGLFWPLTRIAAMLAIAPIFGARMVPVRIRLILALLLTAVVMPMLPAMPPIDPLSAAGLLVLAQQFLIGLAIGFSIQLVFATLIVAGQTAAMGMGLGFASMVDPQNGIQVPVVGQYYVVIATLLFLAMNGHLALIQVLVDSFQTLPIGVEALSRQDLREVAWWGGRMFAGAVMVALPAVAAILLANLAFGVVSRAAPQLNIFGVGFPVVMTLGFVALFFIVPTLLPHLDRLLQEALGSVSHFGQGGR